MWNIAICCGVDSGQHGGERECGDFTGNDGCTTMINASRSVIVIGARSFTGS